MMIVTPKKRRESAPSVVNVTPPACVKNSTKTAFKFTHPASVKNSTKQAHKKVLYRESPVRKSLYAGRGDTPMKKRWQDALRAGPTQKPWKSPFRRNGSHRRSSTTFKLKHRVRVCEMWTSDCVDDVSEVSLTPDKSFVIGWPTTNYVATFSNPEAKQLWQQKIRDQIIREKDREEPKTLVLKIMTKEMEEYSMSKCVTVTNLEGSQDIVRRCIDEFHIEGDAKDYQLWAVSGKEEATPYPLIGHEQPYSIKMNHVRDAARTHGDEFLHPLDLDNSDLSPPVQFVLRNTKKLSRKSHLDDGRSKKKKSPRFGFLKSTKRREIEAAIPAPTGKLFGHGLEDICGTDGSLPKPLLDMMYQIFVHGPYTTGMFRTAGNKRVVRECREKLDVGEEWDFSEMKPENCGALLKDYLKSLPDHLILPERYAKWTALQDIQDHQERIRHNQLLIDEMSKPYAVLLSHLMCVLHYIHMRSAENKMDAGNLGVCIGPTILKCDFEPELYQEEIPRVAATLKFLIENCEEIFGADALKLFGEPIVPKPRQDSSTDSDSMHSMLSLPEQQALLRRGRNDSSIDSLEMCHADLESSPRLPLEGRLSSTTILSSDSGLPMSEEAEQDALYRATAESFSRSISQADPAMHEPPDLEPLSRSCDSTLDRLGQTPPVPPPRRSKGRRVTDITCSNRRALPIPRGAGIRVHNMRQIPHMNRMSSDSLGSLEENSELTDTSDDFRWCRDAYRDMGVLRKSESGAHLYMDEDAMHAGIDEVSSAATDESEKDLPPSSTRNIKRRKEQGASNPNHRHTWSEYSQGYIPDLSGGFDGHIPGLLPDLSATYAGHKLASVRDEGVNISASYAGPGNTYSPHTQFHMSPDCSPEVETRGMSQVPVQAPPPPRAAQIIDTPTHRPRVDQTRVARPQELNIHPAVMAQACKQGSALPSQDSTDSGYAPDMSATGQIQYNPDTSGTSSPRTDEDDGGVMRKRLAVKGMTVAGGDLHPKHQMKSLLTRPLQPEAELSRLKGLLQVPSDSETQQPQHSQSTHQSPTKHPQTRHQPASSHRSAIEKSASDTSIHDPRGFASQHHMPALHQHPKPPAYNEAAQRAAQQRPTKPPSYEEAMERRSLRQAQVSAKLPATPTSPKISTQEMDRQRQLSSKARRLYEESQRSYEKQEETSPPATHDDEGLSREDRDSESWPRALPQVTVLSPPPRSASEERHASPARHVNNERSKSAGPSRQESQSEPNCAMSQAQQDRKRITRHNAYRATKPCERTNAPNIAQLQRCAKDNNKENKQISYLQEHSPAKGSSNNNNNVLQRSPAFDEENIYPKDSLTRDEQSPVIIAHSHSNSTDSTNSIKNELTKLRFDHNGVNNKYEAELKGSNEALDKRALTPNSGGSRGGSPFRKSSVESRNSSDRDSKHRSKDATARTERREARLAKQRDKPRAERLSDTRLNNHRRVKPRNHLNRSKSDSSEHLNKLAMFKELCLDSKLLQFTEKDVKQSHNEAERNNVGRRRSISSMKSRNWHQELADQYKDNLIPVNNSTQKYSYAVKPVPQNSVEVTPEGEKPKRRWAPPVHPSKDLIIAGNLTKNNKDTSTPAQRQWRHSVHVMSQNAPKAVGVDSAPTTTSSPQRPPSPPVTMENTEPTPDEPLGISWSVAKLRNLYAEDKTPPPYRNPPAVHPGKVVTEATNKSAAESYV